MKYLLFDLDGTLTDPKIGITECIKYALKEFGIEEKEEKRLEYFIGPPLYDTFRECYDFTEEQAKKAIEKYRERFSTVGLFENKLYDGIPDLLETLIQHHVTLAIASSKPTVFVERILEHFSIKQHFETIIGANLDGTCSSKQEVIQAAIAELGIENKKEILLVGDRKFDVIGAHEVGIKAIGVTYGYGGFEELYGENADYIVHSVEELKKLLLSII